MIMLALSILSPLFLAVSAEAADPRLIARGFMTPIGHVDPGLGSNRLVTTGRVVLADDKVLAQSTDQIGPFGDTGRIFKIVP